MRKLLILNIFFFCFWFATAQKYGNEWVNYSQQYFKFPVPQEGIYRIDSTTLSKYFNLTSINPKNFQVFIKGKEQFVFINGEADDKINSGDYIEFYANSLMSEVDSMVYSRSKYVPNPYNSLFNDTVYAFLTINNSLNNKRYILETDTNSVLYPVGNYFYNKKTYSGKQIYNHVDFYPEFNSDPNYTQAEGWGLYLYRNSQSPLASLSSPFSAVNVSPSPTLQSHVSLNYSGTSLKSSFAVDHRIQVSYNDLNNNEVILGDTTFSGYQPVRRTFFFNSQTLGNNSVIKFKSISDPQFPSIENETTLHYLDFVYPQNLNLNNENVYTLFIDNEVNANKAFFNFINFNYGGSTSVLLYDLTNGKLIKTVINPPFVRAVIPNGSGTKKCFLAGDRQVKAVTQLQPVNQNGYFNDYKTIQAKKPFVLIYNKTLQTSAAKYQNYRQSPEGGGYDVIFSDVNSLYEQFSYGVNKHPAAIKNFIRYLADSLKTQPKYIFLVGKGVKCESILGAADQNENLVPCIGVPSNDNLFTSTLSKNDTNYYSIQIPIGRIAALNNNEVDIYLSKVQQFEAAGQVDWKKNVLHFIGGTENESAVKFSGFMESYKQLIEDTLYGAKVTTFKKNTTAPIQTNINDSVFKRINDGCSILTFFGHGGESELEISIDDPSKYNNKGKYPFLIVNACNAGNIHIPTRRSLSERFVFEDQKGSIGFLSPVNYGYDFQMAKYSHAIYEGLSYKLYNQGIGDMVKYATQITSTTGIDPMQKFLGMNMALHGDPSIVFSSGLLPDYKLTNNDVQFDLNKYTDSLGIFITFNNGGKAISDSVSLKIERYFPTGDSLELVKKIAAPKNNSLLKYYIPIDFKRGFGLNNFYVKVDYLNLVKESNENNNATTGLIDYFIPGGDILPVYPYKYAIIPKSTTLTLKASTTDPFAVNTTYIFQLDTVDSFNSPFFQSTKITSKGGVIEWNINLPLKDSTVYFWRVSHDSTKANTGYSWRECSFQTIGTKRGWAQAHFHQFKSDGYQFVKYKKELRKFIFENSINTVECFNAVWPYTFEQRIFSSFNKIKLFPFGCSFNGWNFVLFDSISGQPQRVYSATNYTPNTNVFGSYGNCICENNTIYGFHFGPANKCAPNPNWKSDMEVFINSIPKNNYVLAYPIHLDNIPPRNAQLYTYSNSLHQAFESIGAGKLRTLTDTVPYILFGKKGMQAGQGNEVFGKNLRAQIYLKDSITTRWNNGYVVSEIIGPSFKWNSLHWRVKSLDNKPGDTTRLKLIGITSNGKIDTLANFVQDSTDILNLQNYVNAATHPFLKLVAFMKDNINTTSPQITRWQVIYDEAPECAINPLKGFSSINDTLQEGDKVTFRFPIENVGIKNFEDTLVTTYWIEDNKKNKILLPEKLRAGPFTPGQVIIDTISVNSYQLLGDNALWIFVNPLKNKRYQFEQYQFNNLGRFAFKVNSDITNPLLDVTFDGVRILNGDIVSSRPNIFISLKDENKFLALNDTSAFTVYIQEPGQSKPKRIYFATDLQFTPANLPKNSCTIQYNPIFFNDGKYTLMVQAKDRSANKSGSQDYSVQFEIITKPSVTNVMNYPNPFTSSTKFVFTLTGSEIPEVFTIQVMTITGKIVREITRPELGTLRIGRNITDYAWDGKDNYGDMLANGVYLYRVITKLNGENIEKFNSAADKFFIKDFGKMVLMR